MKISIIIPVYNEERTLLKIIEKIKSVPLEYEKEIIVIDDGSTDKSFQIAKSLKGITLLRHPYNTGKGGAVKTGIKHATGDIILFQDADMEYDPNDYKDIISPFIKDGADIVYGSRFIGKKRENFFTHTYLANKFLSFLTRIFTDSPVTDMETCYKAFKTNILRNIVLKENRFGIEPEITAKISRLQNLKYVEVPISYVGRSIKEGKKVRWWDGVWAIWCIFKYGLSARKLIVYILSLITLMLLIVVVLLSTLSSNENHSKYTFLSKRIFIENQNDIIINFSPLRKALRDYYEKTGGTTSLYFEYLPSGSSIGIDDRLPLEIASLIKIPLVMTVYKEVEKGNVRKDDVLLLDQEDIAIGKSFGNLWKNPVGTKVTVEDAMELTIKQSDNAAANMLLEVTNEESINELFDDLDIERDVDGKIRTISPKSYASILRSLYLSSFLSNEYSNEILEILSETDFKNKIEAGVPKKIPVAHKIGVWEIIENGKEFDVYSDCGIVYVPSRPYILCIMVRDNETNAIAHMSKLSEMIYKYVTIVKK